MKTVVRQSRAIYIFYGTFSGPDAKRHSHIICDWGYSSRSKRIKRKYCYHHSPEYMYCRENDYHELTSSRLSRFTLLLTHDYNSLNLCFKQAFNRFYSTNSNLYYCQSLIVHEHKTNELII